MCGKYQIPVRIYRQDEVPSNAEQEINLLILRARGNHPPPASIAQLSEKFFDEDRSTIVLLLVEKAYDLEAVERSLRSRAGARTKARAAEGRKSAAKKWSAPPKKKPAAKKLARTTSRTKPWAPVASPKKVSRGS